jgi:hypothetical protein
MMQHGVTDGRLARLNGVIGVDRRTVLRWLQWWRDAFTATAFWRNARAAFSPPVEQDSLPATLLERFRGEAGERLIALLRLITPITGGKAHIF